MTAIAKTDRAALEALVIDSEDLGRLEVLIGTFNIFEAVGAVHQELRHSAFLAFLLDPSGSHGLGAEFLRRFLRRAVQGARGDLPLSALDLSVAELDDATVAREWRGIDLLVCSESPRIAVVIENKIGSAEHSDQLRRYHETACAQYPGWHVLGIFLTPSGEPPSHEAFFPCDYATVDRVLREVLDASASTLGDDVKIVAQHYSQLLQRHVVNDSEIARLCRAIYSRHRRALDLIFEHRPDAAARVQVVLNEIVESDHRVVMDHSTKSYIRFALNEWTLPVLSVGQGWTSSGRMLLFEFQNDVNGLGLQLIIGPGPEVVRKALFDAAEAATPTLKPSSRSLNKKWNAVLSKRRILSAKQIAELSVEDIENQLRAFWDGFWAREMPAILAAIEPALAQLIRIEDSEPDPGGQPGGTDSLARRRH